MCKIICTLCMIISIGQLYSQSVGINTDGSIPPISAMFEVKSTNKGILIPRIALVSTNLATPVPVPANSLLVYNTATAGSGPTAVTPGYYYWNGEWIRLLTTIPPSATDAWYLAGNSGINPATQFIGTKDNQPLIFKVNDLQAGKLSYMSQQTLFGVEAGKSMTTTASNEAFGYNALYSNTAGARNTAIGLQSLYSNTGGSDNIGVGMFSLWNNVSGTKNIAIGSSALSSNINSSQNIAIGNQALLQSDLGDFNTAVGNESLFSNTNGDNNTAIGYRANYMRSNGFHNTAIGNMTSIEDGVNYSTAIGSNAIVSCSNCMVLGGYYYPYSVNVGIGTTNPTNALHIQTSGTSTKSHIFLSEDTYGNYIRIKMMHTAGVNSWTLEGNPSDGPVNARFNLAYNGSNAAMSLTGAGDMTIMGSLTQNSDSRLKTNISTISTALATILSLHGYQYTWKDPSRDQSLQTGVLAQEVEKVLPHLVKKDAQGYLSVNYSGLVPYLIESVKEQQIEIERLKKENSELMKLKEDVEALKRMMHQRQ